MEDKGFLSERKDGVKGNPFHSPGEESYGERKRSPISLGGESGSGKTTFRREA